MYSKWIKSGFILAMLLASMVSLSMAGCPWFIKNDLYTAQCGVLKEVPASKGILANDPAGTKVINPELIKIDPKYGTISVKEDGSFVYDPSGATGIRSGTYVIFKYGANNGFCNAMYPGIAKIQVGCKCMPTVEVCDGLDNNCNGMVDEDLGTETCGVGECENTADKCVDGEPNTCVPLDPSPEICDGIDNDCDGLTDEDCGPTCTDGIQNGDERGVDCGGSCPPCSGVCVDPETTCGSYTVCSEGCGGIDNGYCFPTTVAGVGACIANWYCGDQTKRCATQSDCLDTETCTSSCCDVGGASPYTCIPNTLFCEPNMRNMRTTSGPIEEKAGTAANP